MSPKETAHLADLQRWLRWAIKKPGSPQPTPCRLDDIVSSPPLSRERRLGVYATGYLSRLTESLAKEFEAVHAVMKEESFSRLVAAYLDAYPSRSCNIAGVGRHFARFLETSELASGVPFLAQLAELEWGLIEVTCADDAPRFDPGSSEFIVHPSVRLLRLEWPVDEIWNARRNPPLPSRISPSPTHLVLSRGAFGPQVTRIDSLQWKLLSLLQDSCPLAQALEEIEKAAQDPLLAERVQHWFLTWVRHGFLAGARTERPRELKAHAPA